MYVIGLVVAVFVAFILHIADKKKQMECLLLNCRSIKHQVPVRFGFMFGESKDYLTKAGTVIFLASIAMWLLLNFGIHGYTNDVGKFWSSNRTFYRACVKTDWSCYWQIVVLDCRNIGKGSCCIKLCCFAWNSKCKFGSRYGSAASGTCARIWYGKCLLSYDFFACCTSLVLLRWQRSVRKAEVLNLCFCSWTSAGYGMACIICGISGFLAHF